MFCSARKLPEGGRSSSHARTEASAMTLLQIKVIHTIAFFVLSGCVILVCYSGVADRIGTWTWVGIWMIVGEGVAHA